MKRAMLLVLVLKLSMAMEIAHADFTFGEPVNLKLVIPVIDPAHESISCFSYDGLEIYFSSDRPEGQGEWDLWVVRRSSDNEDWEPPENLGPVVNSPSTDSMPSVSSDGLTLFFCSNRSGSNMDIWVSERETLNNPWQEPVNLGPPVNSSFADGDPWISKDGLELYFISKRPGGSGGQDIWVSKRQTSERISEGYWGEPQNLGSGVNSSYHDMPPCLSPDGLLLLFSGVQDHQDRPGGFGGSDMWMTRRTTTSDSWQEPLNLGPKVNSAIDEVIPRISPDGSMLYFSTFTNGIWDNWQVPIIPIVDLNNDGIVDAADMVIMVDNWGTDNSLCDIGPMPWGDGAVDVQDLIVLAEHLFERFPPVEPVEVNEDNDGGQVELEVGQTLVVTLESNPSTGFRWEQVVDPESILKQMGKAEFKPSETGDPPLVGAGGWEIFRFRAIRAGRMTLRLVYHRPWEEGVEPLKTFSLQVVVGN